MDIILERIRIFADHAHADQKRKYTPERYIVHPVRVMKTCRRYEQQLPVLAAALLYDVLEDTPVRADELLIFLQQVMNDSAARETLSLVEELTDVFVKAAFPRLNRRQRKERELQRIIETSPDAQTIKYADIIDNSSEIASHDPDFAPRYLRECLTILENANKGDRELHRIALETVKDKLKETKKNRDLPH